MQFRKFLICLLLLAGASNCASTSGTRSIQSDSPVVVTENTPTQNKPTFLEKCGKFLVERIVFDMHVVQKKSWGLFRNREPQNRLVVFSDETFVGRLLNAITPIFRERLELDKLADAMYRLERRNQSRLYFNELADAFRLKADMHGENLDAIPKDKPVIFYANHPKSGADAFLVANEIVKFRPDLKIIAAAWFETVPGFKENAFIINNHTTPEAKAYNKALYGRINEHMKNGGALLIFPSGGISGWVKNNRIYAKDDPWKDGILKFADQSDETLLVPMFVWGQPSEEYLKIREKNRGLSRVFLFRELANTIDTTLGVTTGATVLNRELRHLPAEERLKIMRRMFFSLGREYFETLAPGKSQELIDFASE